MMNKELWIWILNKEQGMMNVEYWTRNKEQGMLNLNDEKGMMSLNYSLLKTKTPYPMPTIGYKNKNFELISNLLILIENSQ